FESHPVRAFRIADPKLPISPQQKRLHAFDEELAPAHHDPRVAVPRAVVVVMPDKTFPLLLRFETLRAGVLLTDIPVRTMIRLRHLLILTHKPQQVRIEIRMLHEEAVAAGVLEHDSAIR